ncbi:hypothetical protein [Austwickia chelonae]|uniref:hypothetical protein n=1 Tax=Austwickia chelonae TaxID=100225 RepID=UPI000E24A2D3|nr:hypothetical protein [Austwickia chelonae]
MKGLTDAMPATVLLGLMLVTGLVPQQLATALGEPTSTVPQNHHEAFPVGKKGDKVEFLAPAGWERTARSSKGSVTYTKDKRTVQIVLSHNVPDREIGTRRLVQGSVLDGEFLKLEEAKLKTPNGFEGHSCVFTNRDNSRRGNCAVIGRNDFLLKVLSTTERGQEPLSLDTLISSFTLKESK